DRGERGHHCRDAHARGFGLAERVERGLWAAPPRLVGVVLEPERRRHAEAMWHAGARDHVAVAVGGDGLHRRGPDVNAHRDLGHRPPPSPRMITSTSSCKSPFVVTASPPSTRGLPSRSENRPPASSTITWSGALSHRFMAGSTAMSALPSATS